MKIKMYAAVAALVLLPAPAAATGWPQSGYGPGNTFYNPDESRLNSATIAGVRQRWTLTSPYSYGCQAGTDPIVSDGRLFTADKGGFGAYDPATGTRRWHVALPDTTIGRLAAVDGRLLVLTSVCQVPAPYESRLSAYDPATGRLLWSAGLRKFTFDMRVDRGVVALNSNQNGVASTVAYRAADGRPLWLLKGDRGDGLVSAGGRLLLRTAAGGAKAVAITTGKTLWQTKQNRYAVGTDPDGGVFYLDGAGLTAVDAATGKVRWATTTHVAEVTTDRRHVFYGHDRSIVCLDAATGRKLYSVHTPGPAGRAVRAGGLLYVGSGTRSPMTIADAATGAVRAAGMPSNQNHAPVIADGRIFVTEGDALRAYY
ncbi:MAG: PQQ-binding-like beta-propeller repeat protein [Actinoplanes sp.]